MPIGSRCWRWFEARWRPATSRPSLFDDGLVIDTVDLYRLWHNVKRGRVTPEDARAKLLDSKGCFAHAWAVQTPEDQK